MTKKIKVLVTPSDRTGVGSFRSVNPHLALENLYPDEFHIDIDYQPKWDDDKWLKQYDIIHFHRTFGPYEKMEDTIKRIEALGIVIIMDIDDHWAPGKEHPSYFIIKEHELDKKILSNLKLAPYITTTTKFFKEEIEKHSDSEIYVLENAINPEEKQFTPNPEPSDRLRIMWLGGSSHEADLNLLKGVVNRLKSDGLMDKVQFVLCGFDIRGEITMINRETGEQTKRPIKPEETVWNRYESIFTDDFTTISDDYRKFLKLYVDKEYEGIENECYRRVWTKSINSYASNYNLGDITLAPLVENDFNKVKSELKIIESGFHKKALIAQDFGPYKIRTVNAIEKGGKINPDGNVLLVDSNKNHKQWYKHIKRLITDEKLRNQLIDNLHNTVKDVYNADAVAEKRAKLYRELLNK